MTATFEAIPSPIEREAAASNPSVSRIIALGVVASAFILVFTTMRGWPFHTLTSAPWLFQINTSSQLFKYSFLVGFYAAVAAFCWAWVLIMRAAAVGTVSRRQSMTALVLWSLPLLIGTPLFSGDVYVYAIHGLMGLRGFDPYSTGASVIGPTAEVLTIHSLWRDTPTMYGPVFMRLMQGIVAITGDNLVAAVLIFRTIVFASLVAAAGAMWSLADRLGRPPAQAFVFTLLNPLLMFHMIGGGHNDGLMLAFMIFGLAVGIGADNWPRRGFALLLFVVAAEVKLPGFAGVFVLGWIWAGGQSVFRRLLAASIAGVVGGVMFVFLNELTGLGWGWTRAFDVSGLAHPLLAPANAVGIGLGGLVGLAPEFNAVTRVVATVLSLVLAVYFVLRTGRTTSPAIVLRATGWSLFALAWLGPAVHPWYLVWGLTFVGLAGAGLLHRYVVGATVVLSFAVSPGGYGNLDLVGGWWRVVIALGLSVFLLIGIRKILLINGRLANSQPALPTAQ